MILKEKILKAVEESVKDISEVGILFSGGVDSSLLAFICSKILKKKVFLYCAGVSGAEDLEWADKVAEFYGFDLKKHIIKEDEVKEAVKEIVKVINSNNYVKVSVALPFYFGFKLAEKDGIKTVLSGLGSEELFAGYERHVQGDINEECRKGIEGIYERDLSRDIPLSESFGIELRVPFLDKELVEYALEIPAELKIKDGVKKFILREAAVEIGLNREFAFRKKKAAQYGSKADRIISKLAKREKMSKSEWVKGLFPERRKSS